MNSNSTNSNKVQVDATSYQYGNTYNTWQTLSWRYITGKTIEVTLKTNISDSYYRNSKYKQYYYIGPTTIQYGSDESNLQTITIPRTKCYDNTTIYSGRVTLASNTVYLKSKSLNIGYSTDNLLIPVGDGVWNAGSFEIETPKQVTNFSTSQPIVTIKGFSIKDISWRDNSSENVVNRYVVKTYRDNGEIGFAELKHSANYSYATTINCNNVYPLTGDQIVVKLYRYFNQTLIDETEGIVVVAGGGAKVKVGKDWKIGTPWIEADGQWRRSTKVYCNNENIWKQSVDNYPQPVVTMSKKTTRKKRTVTE